MADIMPALKKNEEEASIDWPAAELTATLPDNLIPDIR